MNEESGAQVVVVGNGAVGSAIALELVRRGRQVTVVGPRVREMAASVAAGAMLGCYGEVTRLSAGDENAQAKLRADKIATDIWPEWEQSLLEHTPAPRLISDFGTTVMRNTVGGGVVDDGNFYAIKAALDSDGAKYETVAPSDIPWIAPDDLDRPVEAIHIPGERSVDSGSLLAATDKALRAAGASLLDARVARVIFDNGRCSGVELEDGSAIRADEVLVAAGAASLDLLDRLDPGLRDRIPPLFSGYGVSAILRSADGEGPQSVLRTPNRAFACGLHAVPRQDGSVYVGGTNVVVEHSRATATPRDLTFLLECAIGQFHTGLAVSGIERVNVGNRPVPADGFPLVGRLADGLSLATGTYRDGFHQSPLLARHMASVVEASGSIYDPLFEKFAPVRKPLQVGARSEIIEVAIAELTAVGFEAKWRVAPEWPAYIAETSRTLFEGKAAALGSDFTPAPDMLAKMTPSMMDRIRNYYEAWN